MKRNHSEPNRSHNLRRLLTGRLFAALLAALLLLTPSLAFADANCNDDCTIEVRADNVTMNYLTDNTFSTTVSMHEGDGFTVKWTEKRPVAALYWEWLDIPTRALVECVDAAGSVVSSREYGNVIRFLTVFPEAGVTEIRMTVLEGEGKMAELFAYSEKQVQPKAIAWEEPLDKTDILLVEARGYDDILVFTAVLPTYTDRGYTVSVADIACDTIGRQRKSSPGSYLSGLRHFKTFFEFKDKHVGSYSTNHKLWFDDDPRDPIELLTAEIRRVKPEVVVTHDIVNGDYGDGRTKLTAEITRDAVAAAADPAQYPDSAAQYGAWQVKKLYYHLYPENTLTIDVDTPLAFFDGKTARELAVQGMILWDKEELGMINGIKNDKYQPSQYGLAFSTVGDDVNHDDFLENIPPEDLSNYVPPTPSPTPEPTEEPTVSPTPEPTEAPTAFSTPEPVGTTLPETTPQPDSAQGGRIPIVPIAIGAAAVLAVVIFLIARKKR